VDPGYRVEDILTARITLPGEKYPDAERRTQFFSELKGGIEALPGVQSVGVVSHIPILNRAGNVAIWAPERPPDANTRAPWADRRLVLPGYFETMKIPLLEGRYFDERDAAGSQSVIILTRRTVELVFPDEPALGRQVAVDVGSDEPGYFEVVGIVEDAQLNSLGGSRRSAMYFPYAQISSGNMGLVVATAVPPQSLARPIQERLWEMDRDIVLSAPRTMEDVVSNSIGSLRAVSGVLGVFAIVAMALAALGLYGVLAFLVNKRVREIGIRVAMGATAGRVMRLVLSRGMALVLVGVLLGIGGALAASRFVESMLFQTSARDPWTYAGVTMLFLVVALGACVLPGWRATRVSPVEAFRAE
jgi:predicted permease